MLELVKFLLLMNSLKETDPKYVMTKINDKTEFFVSLATQLKQLWPTGSREINGKRYSWQDSVQNLVTRLKLVWNSRGFTDKYTADDVLQCARQYLSDFENDTKYMLSLPYWICKDKTIKDAKGKGAKVFTSKMADLLEGKTAAEADTGWESVFTDVSGTGDLV